jgi:uncharacterized protein (DUF362 family)
MRLKSDLSRRDFLATMAAAAAAGACSRLPDHARGFTRPSSSPVALFAAADYSIDLAGLIVRGLGEIGASVRDKRVLLKPNMVEYEPGTAINTHPVFVAAAAEACRRAGAKEVVVAEGPGHRRDIEYLLSSTGLANHLREDRIPFVDLNHDDVRVTRLGTNFTGLGELALPAAILAADVVISLPKLKTHHWAGMTCGMKNLFGVVPGAVYGWPKNVLHVRGIFESIVDLAATVKPQLTIVDGITAMEGDGPIMGQPRALGMVAMGTDVVAVDATCARVIGLAPEKMGYLTNAGQFLGNIDERRIEHRGEALSRFATQFAVLPELAGLKAGG